MPRPMFLLTSAWAVKDLLQLRCSLRSAPKRYFNGQGDCPVVAHPTQEGTFRWFSLDEVKRLHGIRQDYHLGGSKTLAGGVIGQGVVVSVMAKIIAVNLRKGA